MEERELVSVVVPVYGVERFLKACVDSVRAQTYRELEIILVDDGSKDGSGAMCDAFRTEDDRIRVIHQQNAGLSEARNSGLRTATGKYIVYYDSDDTLRPQMVERLLRALKETGSDIACCGYCFIEEDGGPADDAGLRFEDKVWTPDGFQDTVFHSVPTNAVVWNKLYRAELVKDLPFRRGKINEDEFFTYLAVDRAKKIVSVSDVLCCHRKNGTSITHAAYGARNLDKCEALIEKAAYFDKKGDVRFTGMSVLQFCTSMSMIGERLERNDSAAAARYEQLKKEFFRLYNGGVRQKMPAKVRLSVLAFRLGRKPYMAVRAAAKR